MKQIKFDFNNMFSFSIGKGSGVVEEELVKLSDAVSAAHRHFRKIISRQQERINLGLEWVKLPFQDKKTVRAIQRLGDEIARQYENVLFLGIGGSYLGLKAAQDALRPAYYNEFSSQRCGRPRVYFEGNNLDPQTLNVLLKNISPKKTFVVVISKSGETTETKAAFNVVERWLEQGAGKKYKHQIFAITDPERGSLRERVNEEQSEDALSFRNLPLLKGVGGRFSELNIGLLHLAIAGIEIKEVLAGAAGMLKRCAAPDMFKNPAYMYALLQTVLYQKKSKTIAIMMPFSETLKSTADWYSQMLAESLGKKYARKIQIDDDGKEIWQMDKKHIVNFGRTPVPCRGTNDLHSIQQNNIEGENNKVVTFIKVEGFKDDIILPETNDILRGRRYSQLLNLAEEATEWALVRQSRPNCAIILPEITPYHWGALLFFFEMATAFEGELLNINAFDQPGVEGYKNYMYFKLNKPNIPLEIVNEIKDNPLLKKKRWIM
ncbi:MAG: glucose-6-phosphate isomerase [Candidatus Omnitrophota bacterium]